MYMYICVCDGNKKMDVGHTDNRASFRTKMNKVKAEEPRGIVFSFPNVSFATPQDRIGR